MHISQSPESLGATPDSSKFRNKDPLMITYYYMGYIAFSGNEKTYLSLYLP